MFGILKEIADGLSARALRIGRPVGVALLCVGALGACAGVERHGVYDEAYPLTVELEPALIEVPVGATLDPRDARRIDAFGRDYLRLGVGPLSIGYPEGSASKQIVAATARRLHALGVPGKAIQRGSYDPEEFEGAGVVLFFERPYAQSGGCPKYWGETMRLSENAGSARFGCAIQQNLAAMVADPRDLEGPAPMGPAGSGPRLRVIRAAEAGQATSAEDALTGASTTN